MAGSVSTATDDSICTITVANPGNRNALSPSMLATFVVLGMNLSTHTLLGTYV